jgi:hypothetical protein
VGTNPEESGRESGPRAYGSSSRMKIATATGSVKARKSQRNAANDSVRAVTINLSESRKSLYER